MSAHLLRIRLFQRHLWILVWVWVWVWDWIHSHTSLRTRSPSSRHPPFTHYPFPPRSLLCGGQLSPHKSRLVVFHSTCPPLSSSPHAHSFVLGTTSNSFIIGTAVINTVQTSPHRVHTGLVVYRSTCPSLSPSPHDAPVHRKDLTSLQSPKRPKLFHIRVH
jgi:hypothetical protein